MFGYLAKHKTAHPISGMQITLDKNGKLKETFVQGKPLQKNKKYWIATNNYLYRGGDNMVFLGKADKSEDLNYKLRNVFIDYFKKHDTINPQRDQRFSQEK
jgi:2',3'-cyclic-nucleotide 2'-phosphodiesterase (5'-nucleotidase family)